jgi:hypothetical protein
MTGPGKYDQVCTEALETAQAECVLLIILNGNRGSGFSVNSSRPRRTGPNYADILPANPAPGGRPNRA